MELSKTEQAVLRALFDRKDSTPSTDDIVKATSLSRAAVQGALASLQERGLVTGPKGLLQQSMDSLQEMDSNFKPTHPGYAEHILLLASVSAGANDAVLAAELGYDKDFVATVGSRLRSAGIWSGDILSKKREGLWCKDVIAFFLDGAVATGDLKTVEGPDGEPQYQMTEGGKAHVAKLLKRK